MKAVSVLFNEPKLLKCAVNRAAARAGARFSALQRAEIAEIVEIRGEQVGTYCFSALQRAEIAEITNTAVAATCAESVSVLFNEPKLLKFCSIIAVARVSRCFSALQRAEIAEIVLSSAPLHQLERQFQCSSTSRNC